MSLPLYGQIDQIENLMTRRYLSCADIFNNVSYLIPEYYEKENKDTLQAIIAYWENRCGISEALVRCKILLSIDEGNFSENLYNDNILNMLRDEKIINTRNLFRNYWDDYSYDGLLTKFTTALAQKLLETKEVSAIEKFFLNVYANDFTPDFQILESDDFNGTRIKELYIQEKKACNQTMYFNGELMAGVWIPQGNLTVIGAHPFLGVRPGLKYKKMIASLTLGFKFIESRNKYQVFADNVIWDTNHFFGGYIGLDIDYELFRLKKNSIGVIGGIALDGFDTLNDKKDSSKNKVSKSVNSLNLNIGLGYKFHFKNQLGRVLNNLN